MTELQAPDQPWRPRAYTELLRGPRHRWWRPLVGLAVVLGGLLVVGTASGATYAIVELTTGATFDEVEGEPWSVALDNLALAALGLVGVLAVWWAHRVRPGWVSSVTGRLRWRWLAACTAVSAAFWAVAAVVFELLTPGAFGPVDGTDVLALLVVVALTTPLQAAGEEYLVRGWLAQAVASWVPRPVAGAVLAATVSATVFTALHGSADPWVVADLFAFAVLMSVLVHLTGGLEAAVAVHACFNVALMVPAILTGDLLDTFVDDEVAVAPTDVAVSFALTALLCAVLVLLARRARVQRLATVPPPAPAPPQPPQPPPHVAIPVRPPAGRT